MPEWLPYNIVLGIHVGSFLVNLGMVIVADGYGARWVLGQVETLHAPFMRWLHRLISVGLGVSIISGALLFSTVSDYLLTVPAFYTKLAFVAALVINAWFIGRHMEVATRTPFRSLARSERIPLYVSGVVSTASWIGVVVAAQFLGL